MKHIISFIFVAMLPVVASAYSETSYIETPGYDVKVDGVYYKFSRQSPDEAMVSYIMSIYRSGVSNDGEVSSSTWYESDYSGDVVIPESFTYNDKTYRVTGIYWCAFYDCKGLTSVTIPSSVKSIGAYTFHGCTGLTSVTIPSSVTNIGEGVFEGCTGLTSVTIPSSITSISANAFYGCKGLTSITIPSSITEIGANAFENCTGFTSITIPQSVTKIGKEFIKGCSGLTDLYCLSENPPEATNAFSYNSISNITLHVPEGSEDSYKATVPWCYFFAVLPDGSILINETCFPDPYFRSELQKLSVGGDGVLTVAEMASVKSFVFYRGDGYSDWCGPIKSLQGIEFFPELTKLSFDGISLEELDLTKNTKLKELRGYCRTLKKLNVSGCSELTELACEGSSTEYVDVSGCTSLKSLNCNNKHLVELNASGCTSLTWLECEANNLNVLDVSGCTALTHLKYWKNKLKGAGMDALIESLPVTSSGSLYVYWNSGGIRCQNEMTTRHVAAAKAKGWAVRSYENNQMQDYVGIEATDIITFTQDQMATIILPTAPDASKGKYYRLDRCEDGQIVFAQELQPQARTPYIIVPNQDFSIEVKESELEGLSRDSVSIGDVTFIGSYVRTELPALTGGAEGRSFYIDIIDTTPDCHTAASDMEMSVVGALRAYLIVRWDDPIDHGGPRIPPFGMQGIFLLDYGTGISISPDPSPGRGEIYDLSGRKINGQSSMVNGQWSMPKGIYIVGGKKVMK